ncbi:MAG TPA: hypothetical protein VM012_14875 [Flavitalea sp.]|nr:hypothetical protein [Flavitalea sp.]
MLHTITGRSKRIFLLVAIAIVVVGVTLKINHRGFANELLLIGCSIAFIVFIFVVLGVIKKSNT